MFSQCLTSFSDQGIYCYVKLVKCALPRVFKFDVKIAVFAITFLWSIGCARGTIRVALFVEIFHVQAGILSVTADLSRSKAQIDNVSSDIGQLKSIIGALSIFLGFHAIYSVIIFVTTLLYMTKAQTS